MNSTVVRDIAESVVTQRVGFIEWETFETSDDAETALGFIKPQDSSAGFIEVRYSASCYDSGVLNMSGYKIVPYTKDAGVVTLGADTDLFFLAGSGIMASTDLSLVADGENINIIVTGALALVKWDIKTFLHYSIAQNL